MNDAQYGNLYWIYADQQENDIQSYITDLNISDIITQVFNRFTGVDLNKMLSMSEVVKLHRNVEKWLDNGLDERQYRLILQDIERRKQIREREALSIWLLAALCTYYAGILSKSTTMYAKIAADSYGKAFKDAQGITDKGTPKPPTQATVAALMKEVNPSLRRTIDNQLWIEAQHNRDTLLSRYNSDVLAGRKFNPDENRRKFQSIEDKLLKRSTPTANEPDGHHGILDQQMTFITGYTVIKAFKDAGARRVKFIATIDGRTTHACEWLNGKVFDIDALKLGVNAPPISIDKDGMPIPHPCRSFLRTVITGENEVTNAIRSSGDGEQSKPHTYRQIGTIDRNDTGAVNSLLEAFQKRFVDSKTEHCLVIAKNGDVFLINGDESTVDTSLLGGRMNGSINIHNHPTEVTQYSFSEQDVRSFLEDGSSKMLAFDDKYLYEMTKSRDSGSWEHFDNARGEVIKNLKLYFVKNDVDIMNYEYTKQHVIIKESSEMSGLNYTRRERK